MMHIRNPMEWLFAGLDAAGEVGSAPAPDYFAAGRGFSRPVVQRITNADLRLALARGMRDFAAARTDVIFVCIIYPIVGLFLTGLSLHEGLLPLLFPVASGFALIGPFAAIGLYEMSRRRELTGRIDWLDVFKVVRSPSIGAIAALGLGLIVLFTLWLLTARGIYNITLGPLPPASTGLFLTALFSTGPGWAMIGLGLGTGALFAVVALALSVVSFPLLLDRPVSLSVAIETSITAVRRNPGPLALWGLIVASGLFIGSLPLFIGLVVVLPILGHSTWHLYRLLVTR